MTQALQNVELVMREEEQEHLPISPYTSPYLPLSLDISLSRVAILPASRRRSASGRGARCVRPRHTRWRTTWLGLGLGLGFGLGLGLGFG